jgi:two-component system, OmpR family, sensor kinase
MAGRLPLRARLTAAFALAMVLVLVAAGLFVYARLRADLDEGVDAGLRARSGALGALVARSGPGALAPSGVDPEEGFGQVLTPAGRLTGRTGGARRPALSPLQARRAARVPLVVERHVSGVEGTSRLLARPLSARGRTVVVVVGSSLEDRDETLSGLITSFVIGGPIAVLAASGLGYLLAAAGLAPMEAMRRRAERISLGRRGERLPLPRAHDEVRRLGETLNDMLARLESSFERERRFVADAGHEIRTPLAVLKAELEAALRAAKGDPATRESLVAALEECDHLAQLADDLLLIARAGEGRLELRTEQVDVGTLLEQARERFADRARERGRRIEVAAPDGLRVPADPLRLRQALGNLVDNALRHGGGEVSLAAERHGQGVRIEVADQGPGFPAEVAPRAFERFARGDRARTRGGSGLGLAIVRAIAEAHGGTATLDGDRAGGAAVWLDLPGGSSSSHRSPPR